ncbi:hypothetical protein Ancab_003096 [Ancistrocladus abbreviatus]
MTNTNSAASATGGSRRSFCLAKYLFWPFGSTLLSLFLPTALAVLFFRLDPFDPAPYPDHEFTQQPMIVAPKVNDRMIQGSDFVGSGQLVGPEDMAYDPKLRVIYTGCVDGWIKRITVNESASDSAVENWVNTGGRPLGLALGHQNELIVADAVKGLLKVTKEKEVIFLSDEAEGQKFRLTDGVDVANDGTIYFTDASYKYNLNESTFDIFEGRPYGRLLSFDPTAGVTKVLLRHLYFPNGVALSPDESWLIFCETAIRRCRKYCLKCSKETGSLDRFIDNLPGLPDNIHYDGEGHYWIGIPTCFPPFLYKAARYRLVRKIAAIIERYIGLKYKNGGVMAVDLEGKPTSHFYDSGLALITGGIKIGNYVYCGSLHYQHIIRVNLSQHPAS